MRTKAWWWHIKTLQTLVLLAMVVALVAPEAVAAAEGRAQSNRIVTHEVALHHDRLREQSGVQLEGAPPGVAGLVDPPPDPVDPDTDDEETEEGETASPGTGVVETLTTILHKHIINFPADLFIDAVINNGVDAAQEAYEGLQTAGADLGNGLEDMLNPMGMMKNARQEAWGAVATVAAVLVPLSLLLTVGAAMRDGVTSITGYASAREALMNWFISVALAATSYFIIESLLDLSHKMAGAIGQAVIAKPDGLVIAGFVMRTVELFSPSSFEPGVIKLFLLLFAIIMLVTVIISLVLAFMAKEVVVLLLVALAPLILLMSSVRPLRWLSGLWTKALVVMMILPAANVLLLALSQRMLFSSMSITSGTGRVILGFLIMIGLASILITLNTIVGRMVYGAATVDSACKICPQHKICKPASQIGFARSWMLFPKTFQGQ